MKLIYSLLLLLLVSAANGQGNYSYPDTTLKDIDPVMAAKAKGLVATYARLIFKGDNVDSLTAICGLPFSWDRKRIIDNWADFKRSQQKVIDEKGKNRPYVLDTIFVKAVRHEMLDKLVPLHIYYVTIRVKLKTDEGEKLSSAIFAVQVSEHPVIVGISD